MNVFPHIRRLQHWVESQAFMGWDPYDALNSPIVRALSLGTKIGRCTWTQLFRRCPLNLRPFLATPKMCNAKGAGLFLEAYSKMVSKRKDHTLLPVVHLLLGRLENLRSVGWSGSCWGYPFDWQSRAAFLPAGTPTIVNTSFIGHALLDCYERVRTARAFDLASSMPPFFLKDLNRTSTTGSFCFSYSPRDHNFVHNANMLGASFLLRLGRHADNQEWIELARRSMAYSIELQHPDGSWPYAETNFQSWIDSFHTGFNLEALRWFLRLDAATPVWRDSYRRGVKFYTDHFYLADGTPKYFHNRIYPVDIHAPAEAIYFLSGEGEEQRLLAEKVLAWTMKNLWNERKGYFNFRKTRFASNRIPYMRWSQAWGMRALTEYYVHHAN
jgi:hypothetical protein